MAGWTTLEKLLKGEIIQREEEGCDVTGFAQRLEEAAGDNGRLNRLYDELMELKPGEDFQPGGNQGLPAEGRAMEAGGRGN